MVYFCGSLHPQNFLKYEREPDEAGCNAVVVRSSRRSGIFSGGVDVHAETYLLIIAA